MQRFSLPSRASVKARAAPQQGQGRKQASKNGVTKQQSTVGDAEVERINQFSRSWLPNLLEQQEDAARSGADMSKLMAWAEEIGGRAQQAMADLQRAVDGRPAGAAAKALPPAPAPSPRAAPPPPPPGAPLDFEAAAARLAALSDEVAASNVRFEEAHPDIAALTSDAAPAAAGAGEGSAAAGGASALQSREQYLRELATSMEVAERRMRREEAEAAVAAAEAAAEAAARAAAADAAAAAEAALRAEMDAAAEAAAARTAAAAAAAAAAARIKVDIAVRRETQLGQDVWLVGAGPALGEWDVAAALPLAWTEGHVWRATIEVNPTELPVLEYKAVLKCANGAVVWEAGGNRTTELAPGAAGVALYHEFVA
ncbi:MAG: hypothetical protein J3K34DRAFT_524304 [Monoraphidium minutum]|nr:MAG: hypothetical protein J3K34DRAFT_524304 [Monoraphidium minutum]